MPWSLIAHAGKEDAGYRFTFNQGDLCQMSTQDRFLQQRGFNIGHVDVFPAVATKEEYVMALRLFYENCVEGWWNYRDEFIKHGICTNEEFKMKFGGK